MHQISVGIIGSGFAAELHAKAYQRVSGIQVNLAAVASIAPDANSFAQKYGIPKVTEDYRQLLEDDDIQIVDIVTPPHLHKEMILSSLKAGKYVICEKPLSGCFQENLSKTQMFQKIQQELDEIEAAIKEHSHRFFYAENFIYAPAVQKCRELICNQNSTVMYQRGEESHNGSHADHAAYWKYSGGGALIRQGCHPLSAILYLKYQEGKVKGQPITVTEVFADMGNCGRMLTPEQHQYIESHPVDVEDIASVHLSFSDGSKADILAGDIAVGGVRNLLEVYTEKSVYHCNLSSESGMTAFHCDDIGLSDIYFGEKIAQKAGWQSIALDEMLMRGYLGELQDFVSCAAYNTCAQSDFQIARDTLKIIYAAYASAEKGCKIKLSDY